MLPETMALLRLWEPGLSPAQLAAQAIETGLFSRATARRTRNLVIEMFAPRYLTNKQTAASRFKFLIEHQFSNDSLAQVLFLQTSRAQKILGDFVIEVYWPKYNAGASVITRDDAKRFVYQALDSGRMQKRWSDSTIRRVSGYLIGCCIDFGLLTEGGGNSKTIKRFSIRKDVALYLAYDLHFSGHSDMAVVQHTDWRLFGLEDQDVLGHLKNLSIDGHILIQSSADLVQISWKYDKMEECLAAITQR